MSAAMTPRELAALHRAATAVPELAGLACGDLAPLPARGVAHDHVALGSAWLARVPRFSQWDLPAAEALAYEAAAFARAAASRHTPELLATLAAAPGLPRGALVVRRVHGRPPRLPDDLPALADALAAIHRLPLPAAPAPLLVHDRPARSVLAVIAAQAERLDGAGIAPAARDAIAAELDWAHAFARTAGRMPLCLAGTDTHPGNFVVTPERAWFVDLEKALYGAAGIDLAHATLATSTMWDPACAARLDRGDVMGFYGRYLAALPAAEARALRPWLLPLRRLTWLRTVTWFGRWRAGWRAAVDAAGRDPAFRRHVDRVTAAALRPAAVAAARRDWLGPDPLPLERA